MDTELHYYFMSGDVCQAIRTEYQHQPIHDGATF